MIGEGYHESTKQYWSDLIKLMLIVFSFTKFGHFVSVYEGMGYFILMMQECMAGLIPFVMIFFALVSLFSVLYAVLETELTEEMQTPGAIESLGYAGLLIF